MSSADRVAQMGGRQILTIVNNAARAWPGINAFQSGRKTEQSIYECLLGFCFFNNIFCAAQILAASTVFFCPIPETKK